MIEVIKQFIGIARGGGNRVLVTIAVVVVVVARGNRSCRDCSVDCFCGAQG